MLLAASVLLLTAPVVHAHPLSPALLEVRELEGNRIAVLWKSSILRAPGARVEPILPEECQPEDQPTAVIEGDAIVAEWAMRCAPGGLVGREVGVSGLAEARIDALIRVTLADGRVMRAVVRAGTPRYVVPARERPSEIVRAYVRIGVEHILGGIDHLLFVAGLLLLVRGHRLLLETITAFTVGHSITLALAVLDVLRVPSRPVELLIALSVFVLACELAREPDAPPSLLRRRPWVMALAFGLLHGLGFAGALREVGLPPGDVPLALFAFNVGIELGQLAFVAALLAAAALLNTLPIPRPAWLMRVPMYTIGSLAAFWCFERAAALVG